VISVQDTGVGIPPRHLVRLGERFYRVDRARSRELGGTGLGLAIVKHLVRAHGWEIEFKSTEAAGTTVRIILPETEQSI
jgi:two-component system phosphate regulon sensor histidine kinase PhoR